MKIKDRFRIAIPTFLLLSLLFTSSCVQSQDDTLKWVDSMRMEIIHAGDIIDKLSLGDVIIEQLKASPEFKRDQVIIDINNAKEKLYTILKTVESTPPPTSKTYEDELKSLYDSIIKHIKLGINILSTFNTYLETVPAGGGMPDDLERASELLNEATTLVNLYHDSYDELTGRLAEIK